MAFQRSRSALLLLFISVLALMGCGGFKGVVTPTLSSISTTTIAAGSSAFTLTATGTNFTSGTRIVWDGVAQTTAVVSNTQLTTSITKAQLASPGVININVLKADTTSSNVLQLTITGVPVVPVPTATLTSISPATAAAGGASFTLTATGTNFTSGSMIAWNGVATATTFDSVTQLHATISAAQIALPSTVNVGVLDAANTLSNQLPFTITGGGTGPGTTTPPTLTSLTPATVVAGSPSFLLTATGANFVTGSQITWEGTALTTTFVSATQLTTMIPAALVALAENISVAVLNPDSTISTPMTFIVTANPDATPTLTSITLNSVPVGCGGTPTCTITLVGTNFDATAIAESISSNVITKLATTFVSPTQLTVVVPSSWVSDIGEYPINVVNPYPATPKLSNVLPFYVGIIIHFGEVKDVVWDSKLQLFYVSIPGDSTSNPNKIAAITPAGAAKYYSLPGNPDRLAISSDQQFLYVGLDDKGTVAQLTLPLTSTSTPTNSVSLGTDVNLGVYSALDIQVAPGLPGTIAVARGIQQATERALGGVAVYNLPNTAAVVPNPPFASNVLLDTIQWGADVSTLYAADNEVTGDLYQFSVSSTALTVAAHSAGYYLPLPNTRIHFDANMLYGDDGVVADLTTTPPTQTRFSAQGIMVPDSGLAMAYFLGQNSSQINTLSFSMDSFTLATKSAPVKDIQLFQIQGTPQHMVRWGTNGLAFSTVNIVNPLTKSTTSTGGFYILSGPFVTTP